jgi:hypothetical protein
MSACGTLSGLAQRNIAVRSTLILHIVAPNKYNKSDITIYGYQSHKHSEYY